MSMTANIFLTLVFITLLCTLRLYDKQNYTISRPEPLFNQSPNPVCKSFQLVCAEWTLYWFSKFKATTETKLCKEIYHDIFKQKSVKQIIYPNKTVENLGCTKHT